MAAATALWRFHVTVHTPATEVAARLLVGAGEVEPIDDHTRTLRTGADTPPAGSLPRPPRRRLHRHLAPELLTLATRYLNAIR